MNLVDWAVIVGYSLVLLGMGYFISKRQRNLQDYYLGGRNVKWWHAGLSTMATQLGAISFISAPAFVALKGGGGLKWLEYEFGVPLAMIFLMVFIIPVYHRARVTSIYEYLESRFDSTTRAFVSLLFQISRGLATAVAVLAIGIVISTALGLPLWIAILAIGAVTIIYDAMGGIRVVILSDVIQMLVILVGVVVVSAVAYSMAGGWGEILRTFDPTRLRVLDFAGLGWGRTQEYSFWPMVLGGFFLYASYYGCDQSQVQRELSVGHLDGVRRSLLFNAVGRFPMVVLYCFMGVFIGAFAIGNPEFLSQIPANEPDRLVPLFVLTYLPHGVIGFIFVAILAASMSSLDSALNSMSAALNRDLYQRYLKPEANEAHYMFVSKLFTIFWGIFVIAFAFVFAGTQRTTIEAINMVGSILYGPIL
ncbi:MAG: sodium/solute symporter, partial [Dehalococcoidia bacterium]